MKDCKPMEHKRRRNLRLTNFFLWRALLAIIFLNGCGGGAPQPYIADNPASQRFRDATEKVFPEQSSSPRQAIFFRADQDALPDLIVLNEAEPGKPQLQVFINHGGKSFRQKDPGRWIEELKTPILSFTAADLNRDGGDDLILVTEDSGAVSTQIFFNNRKGYFYAKDKANSYPLRRGMDKVIAVDLDQDGDRDLFYFGRMVADATGKSSGHQTRVLVNSGAGKLEDLTDLLLPRLPAGIRDASFADYDGDGVVDIFLVYGAGQNRLLMNNGVGKFVDRTASRLPRIIDDSEHADWADFDQDGDNDLLIVNRAIDERYRAYPDETAYFLENTGGAHFKKRSHEILPRLPAYKAYLLDANADTNADALILTLKGVYYLQGKGQWDFTDETRRRLPRSRFFRAMAFADIDRDRLLDIFALSPTPGRSRVWLNRFD